MFSYTRKEIFSYTLVFTIIIFCIAQYISIEIINANVLAISKSNSTKENIIREIRIENLNQNEQSQKNNIVITQTEIVNNVWKIEIPQIKLKANIAEGVSQEVMKKNVGHFEQTSKEKGNIGLASHNRGGVGDYFKDIKSLKNGDTIIYKINEKIKQYKVCLVTIIEDKDWSYLQPTEDNRITLITCVENRPSYRRCVQAVEIL